MIYNSKKKSLGYDKCNMPPFSQNSAISAFLGVTEKIEVLQPSINFLTRTLIQMRISLLYMRKYGILADRKSN